jgi:CheY-like chemotaxis protein
MRDQIAAPGLRYILYADDDPDDQAFLCEMMRKVDSGLSIKCFPNGLELVQFLEGLPANAVLPSCIILDLNMPVWDGMHTLKILKDQPTYRPVPVFIFSTSSSERDTHLAVSLGAIAYVTKPYGQSELLRVCRRFADCSIHELRMKEPPVSSSR